MIEFFHILSNNYYSGWLYKHKGQITNKKIINKTENSATKNIEIFPSLTEIVIKNRRTCKMVRIILCKTYIIAASYKF